MIHIVQEWNSKNHRVHLDQMFAMRARVFGQRLGWDVVCTDGQERDSLDNASPVYIIATGTTDKVLGSCRLLPTTGPTLIEMCFSDTFPDGSRLSHPTIWECTRFCIEHEFNEARPGVLGAVTRSIVCAIVDLALHSSIETIIANLDVITLRMCRKAGYEVNLLGVTHRFGPAVYLGAFSIEQAARTRDYNLEFESSWQNWTREQNVVA